MTLDLVVFDWDGTLMDSGDKIVACMRNAAASQGLDEPESQDIRNLIGLSLPETFSILFPRANQQQVSLLSAAYREQWIVHDRTPMPLFEGVVDGLKALDDAGIMLAVATGKARRGLNRVLDETGLRPRFVTSRCADEARPKPDPAMLNDVLDFCGVEASRALMVGDTSYDMQMAAGAGVSGIGVTYGSHGRDTLLEHGAVDCHDSVSALITGLFSRQDV